MSISSTPSISRLLSAWGAGEHSALDKLLARVQFHLRAQAGAFLARERQGHTLQPTALVNEAFLRLVRQKDVKWNDREHFYAVAAMTMRRVLLDAARRRAAARRGCNPLKVSLSDVRLAHEADFDIIDLNHALDELATLHERQAQIVTLRYFGGLSVPAVAKALSVSVSTVESDWRMARAWLRRRLAEPEPKAEPTE